VARTAGRGLGCFANAPLQPGQLVGEYLGVVWESQAWRDAGRSESHYGYEIGALGLVVDAAEAGNTLRWVNHSCAPNMRACAVYADGWHVVFIAQTAIAPGDELCYDYELYCDEPDDWHLQLPCACGAARCRGKLYSFAADT
jgi:SET domain-containing protein